MANEIQVVKLVLVGDMNVGKSAFIRRHLDGKFNEAKTGESIGCIVFQFTSLFSYQRCRSSFCCLSNLSRVYSIWSVGSQRQQRAPVSLLLHWHKMRDYNVRCWFPRQLRERRCFILSTYLVVYLLRFLLGNKFWRVQLVRFQSYW